MSDKEYTFMMAYLIQRATVDILELAKKANEKADDSLSEFGISFFKYICAKETQLMSLEEHKKKLERMEKRKDERSFM